jgi:DNA excision repair protein ERCC-3
MNEEDKLPEKYKYIRSIGKEYFQELDELQEFINRERNQVVELTETLQDETRFSMYEHNLELFKEFLRKPWVTSPVSEGVYDVFVPKFIKFNLGFYQYSTDTYNVFRVNRLASFFGEIPKDLENQFKFREKFPFRIFDGMLLTGEHQDEAWNRYSKHLSRREGSDRIRIKRGHEFNLHGKLLDDGILPYLAQPVAKELLREPEVNFVLRDYQKEAKQIFLEKGAIGVYWVMGAGKTYLALDAIASIKGSKLVIVPSSILVSQWRNRLKEHTSVAHEVNVVTYQLLTHATSRTAEAIKKKEYSLVVYDESHALPAFTYEKLAGLKTLHRIGLSATPFREDGNSWKIIALTGYPVGMNWEDLFAIGVVKKPDIVLYLCKTFQDKKKKLAELLLIPLKTIVFCDEIALGKRLSKEFEYPFVHGETNPKDRIDIITSSEVCFVSRVADQGLSLDIARVIEIDFFAGSRRQSVQRVGRGMHSSGKTEIQTGIHIIIMTFDEFDSHHKRIDVLEQKGLRVSIVAI